METLGRLSLALAVVAFAGTVGGACGEDGDKPSSTVDAAVVDSSTPIQQDSGSTTPPVRPCTSYTPVKDDKCGGSHCTQTEAELKATAIANATCGGDVELKSFCSLEAVNVVSACTLASIGSMQNEAAFTSAITSCSTTPTAQNTKVVPAGFSSACLGCFVESAKCAAAKCLIQCAANPNTSACDECRINQGCIGSFYTCAGITNPLDTLAAAQGDAGSAAP